MMEKTVKGHNNVKRKSRRLRRPAAAEYVGCSTSKLAKLAVTGGGPPIIKIGRLCAYDTDDLDVWLEAQKVSSTSEVPNADAA